MYNCIQHQGGTPEERSQAVKAQASIFQECMISWDYEESITYYMHILYFHLADQIRICPIHVIDVSGSAVEHLNQKMKRVMK